jgi:hypothetical protein
MKRSSTDSFGRYLIVLIAITMVSRCLCAEPIRVPNPSGFIEASALSEKVRITGSAGLSRGSTLLGVYYPTNALAGILNQGFSAPSPFCKAVLQKEYSSVSSAKKEFATLVANAKKEGDRKFDPNDKSIRLIFEHYKNAARKVDPSISVNVKGTTILGSLIDEDTTYAVCMLINFGWSDGETTTEIPYAASLAFTRFDTKQVNFSALYPFNGDSSVEVANKSLRTWLTQIRERNRK